MDADLMIEEDAIQILQFDCTMFGGFTNGKKLSALCELNHIEIAPHHDCYIHAPSSCIYSIRTNC